MRFSPGTCVALLLACQAVAIAQPVPSTIDTAQRLLPEDADGVIHPAYFNELDKARDDLQAGRFRRALYATYDLTEAPPEQVNAIRAEALMRLGETDAALAIAPDELLRARIFANAARFSEAIPLLEKLHAQQPGHLSVRRLLGQTLEAAGQSARAIELYKSIASGQASELERYRREGAMGFELAVDLVDSAVMIDRWATLTQSYRGNKQLQDTVLDMLTKSYDIVDRTYWPGRLEAARFLIARGKTDEAAKDLAEIEKAGVVSPEAIELAAKVSIERRNFDGLSSLAKMLRDIDFNSAQADVIDSMRSMLMRDFDRGLAQAESAARHRPGDIDVLSHLAAVHFIRGEDAASAEMLAKIEAMAPNDARPYQFIGQYCTLFFDAPGAVKHLETAVARAPWRVDLMHDLGDAYLNEGEEDKARAVLAEAYEIEPFNRMTVNYLRVLDDLAKFKRVETDHFVFAFADVDDPIVPLYMGEYMDSVYEELTKRFAFEPPRKPIVEVFPDVKSFSVRTAGLPGLETYGASQGQVMTVVAPRAGETMGPFNWARVMRHEFVHTLNILQTRGRVPRWFTEGLAVWEERVPYRFAWVPKEMYARTTSGKLMSPQMMAEALLRPRGNSGEVAYQTGFWLCEFVVEKQGEAALVRMLQAYGKGLSEERVFQSALGLGLEEFQSQFDAWARQKVAGWGYDEATQKKYDELEEQAQKATDANKFEKAAELWESAATLQPMNPTPPRRLAGVYLKLNRKEEAAKHLAAVIPLELSDNRLALRTARIYFEAGNVERARHFVEVSVQINPYDASAHELFAEVLDKQGDAARAKQERTVAGLLRDREKRKENKQ
jgi:cellulose synthase operon protein C